MIVRLLVAALFFAPIVATVACLVWLNRYSPAAVEIRERTEQTERLSSIISDPLSTPQQRAAAARELYESSDPLVQAIMLAQMKTQARRNRDR